MEKPQFKLTVAVELERDYTTIQEEKITLTFSDITSAVHQWQRVVASFADKRIEASCDPLANLSLAEKKH